MFMGVVKGAQLENYCWMEELSWLVFYGRSSVLVVVA